MAGITAELSNKTKSGNFGKSTRISIGTSLNATDRATTGQFSRDVTTTRQSPNTTIDMENIEKWTIGDDVEGSFAAQIGAFKRYRQDLERAKDEKNSYKHMYVDTLTSGKLVSDQYKELKK